MANVSKQRSSNKCLVLITLWAPTSDESPSFTIVDACRVPHKPTECVNNKNLHRDPGIRWETLVTLEIWLAQVQDQVFRIVANVN
jgi:hypothetical protein